MKQVIHYDHLYTPVASWNSKRMLLIMTSVHSWHTNQLDYVLSFPQAPADRELYMTMSKGVDLQRQVLMRACTQTKETPMTRRILTENVINIWSRH